MVIFLFRVQASHIFRETNKPTNFISKMAINEDVTYHQNDTLSRELYDLLMANCIGVAFPRSKR